MGWTEGQPAAEETGDTFASVLVDKAGVGGGDIGGDVHRMGEQHWSGAGEGFHNGDAEVLLMRGENEGVGGLKGAPFQIALEHSSPVQGIVEMKTAGQVLKAASVGAVNGTGEHETMPLGMPEALALEGGEGVKEKIWAFLGGNPTEEEETVALGDGGMNSTEGGGMIEGGIRDAGGAVIHHLFTAAVEPEGLTGEETFLLAGEADGISGSQGKVNGPGPDEPLLEVLERIGALEPGIEHAVGEHKQGRAGPAEGEIGGKKMKRPDAIHHHAVVVAVVTAKPDDQGEGKETIEAAAIEGMNGNSREGKEGVAGAIAGDDFEAVTLAVMGGCYLPNAFDRTAGGGVDGLDDVQDAQGGEEGIRVKMPLPIRASGKRSG